MRADDHTRFDFRVRKDDGSTVYGASHELSNEVLITFPPGYWDTAPYNTERHPEWVNVDFDTLTHPEYREPPVEAVVAELVRRLPNMKPELMFPGFVAVIVPCQGILACGGDSDGWRIDHQYPNGDTCLPCVDMPELGLDPYEQDVNKIVTKLINAFRSSPWANVIFGYVR